MGKSGWLACLVGLAVAFKTSGALQAAPRAYPDLVNDYFDAYFAANPSAGTYAGFHQYDNQLEDVSLAGRTRWMAKLHGFLRDFEAIDPATLSPSERDDRELVMANIQAILLELEKIQMWRHNPDTYPSGATGSIFTLVKRNFAPPADRLRSVIAREERIPAALAIGAALIKNPPRIYTEIALQQLAGNIGFFETTVPEAFTSIKDPTLLARFRRSNAKVIAALQKYGQVLKSQLLPRSQGTFAIGPENYRQKLLYEEMVDIPLDRLLAIGYEQLRKDQQALIETAKRIDPAKTPRQVQAIVESDHPSAAQLLPSAQKQLDGLRQFLIDHQIITVPGDVQAQVEETPPFLRALTFASMDTPGPYETKATEAYYNITLPDPKWPAKKQEEYLRGYNYPLLNNVSVHEVWPGHYTQFLWLKNTPDLSKVRKLITAGSNSEGWAHYSEQMMLDEGLGNGDPKLRFAQLVDALLRDCRYIVGIQMHTKGMSLAQGVEFFVKEGYQPRVNAEIEARRGTADPTYLVYTLGKLEIFKLRDDYKKKLGDQFSLRDFHDRFVKAGAPPIKLLRRELLGDDSPTL
ncbi:DUF885 domain-containing protein [Gloeobacter kilaueensis]|uniref:DUF885 domain-containing protein n=1 Tax=Gloeobacter kilaueensis (strain ATCC BAA-2537 / CCAP 1431/1 / ULC 316 / JS1) TaxID=1183438 RepID=U5QLD7_GLOK1|nr:DUF885 domain-containing protein [Gloeobacter kilaueensis]AGY59746.1 hypothetical protein GKIL_3500 [Gloeobacter kilaueensis JS1]